MGDQVVQSPFEFYKQKSGAFDFWRCYACGAVITYEQERARMIAMERDLKTTICRCGSMKYKPTNPHGFEWLKLSVVTYVLKLILARGIAPWAEKRFPRALPWIERLSRPTEE